MKSAPPMLEPSRTGERNLALSPKCPRCGAEMLARPDAIGALHWKCPTCDRIRSTPRTPHPDEVLVPQTLVPLARVLGQQGDAAQWRHAAELADRQRRLLEAALREALGVADGVDLVTAAQAVHRRVATLQHDVERLEGERDRAERAKAALQATLSAVRIEAQRARAALTEVRARKQRVVTRKPAERSAPCLGGCGTTVRTAGRGNLRQWCGPYQTCAVKMAERRGARQARRG
jgi:uncharacterized small protein (DUF1192 family)/phage FluMu protein Com